MAAISTFALLLGFLFFKSFYQISSKKDSTDNGLKVMTFNVRGFNKSGQLPQENIDSLIIEFLEKENPDIICMQEADRSINRGKILQRFKYRYVDFIPGEYKDHIMLAVFSKYPIQNTTIIDFPKSYNSAFFTDVAINQDTIRLYNLHLQSFSIVPEVKTIQKENSKKLFGRLQSAFAKQQQQAEIVKNYLESSPYPKLVVGDFNNTQFSHAYQTIQEDMTDTFFDKGNGFGRTYDLRGYPMRIDYILADTSFEVLSHQNYDEELSDHFPVMATLQLKSKQ